MAAAHHGIVIHQAADAGGAVIAWLAPAAAAAAAAPAMDPPPALPGGQQLLQEGELVAGWGDEGFLRRLRARLALEPSLALAASTRGGFTLLYEALKRGHLPAAEALLGAGADLRARTHAGRSLLMACVEWDEAEAARWLLRRWPRRTGRPLDELLEGRSAVGYTPLWWCCMDGQARVAAVLLAQGADDWAEDRSGVSCHAIATQRRMWPVLALLQEAERAYHLARVRQLAETPIVVHQDGEPRGSRASLAFDGHDDVPAVMKIGEDEETRAKRNRLWAVAAHVVDGLALDLFNELDLLMRGSCGRWGL